MSGSARTSGRPTANVGGVPLDLHTILRAAGAAAALAGVLALEIASLSSLGHMLDAITATRAAVLPPGETFGFGIRVVRILGMAVAVLVTAAVFVRKRALPLGDVRDRVVLALVGSSLASLLVMLGVGSLMASPRRTVGWATADLPLVLLDTLFAAALLLVAVRRARWLAQVRRGVVKGWTIEPLRGAEDSKRPKLTEQVRGDGILLQLRADPRGDDSLVTDRTHAGPSIATPVALVDYVDERSPVMRHLVRAAMLVVCLVFALLLGASLLVAKVQPPRVLLLGAGVDAIDITSLAVPEDPTKPARVVKIDGTARDAGGTQFRANVVQMSGDGSCLRDRDGEVLCTKRDTPGAYLQVKNVVGATAVASRGGRGCALLPGGEVRCWMDPSDDPMVPIHAPAEAHLVQNLPPQTLLAVGDAFACGVSLDRRTFCWEPNAPSYTIDGVAEAQTIAVGSTHACAVQKDNTVACWGTSDYGAVGVAGAPLTGTRAKASVTPEAGAAAKLAHVVPGIANAVQLSLGGTHSCARTSDGNVTCWGFLDSDSWDRDPKRIAALAPSRLIASGDGIVCSLQMDKVVCVGDRTAP